MKIAVDADEVIVQLLKSACKFYNEEYKERGGEVKPSDFKKFSFAYALGTTEEEEFNFMTAYMDSGCLDSLELIEGAKKGLELLAEENELVLVTARRDSAEEKTRAYFERELPGVFTKIYLYPEPKDVLCRELGVGVIIEDSVSALGYAERGMDVLLLDRLWNGGIEHPNLCRCEGWLDVVTGVRALEVKNG